MNFKKYILRFILQLILMDIVIIILRTYNLKSIGFLLVPQALVIFINYYTVKSKLYNLIKRERNEIPKKYNFMGKYSVWEWNIIIASNETKDSLLKEVRNKLLVINLASLLLIPNILMMLYVIDMFQN